MAERRPTLTASARAGVRNLRSGRKKACGAVEQKKAQKQGRKRPQKLGLTVPRSYNPHSGVRGNLSALSPRVRSLAAFGRRPPVNVARLSMAGIRNPAHERTHALQQIRGNSFAFLISSAKGRSWFEIGSQACSSSSNALACFKSSVSKPSVNQPYTGAR